MQYRSTRGKGEEISGPKAILQGIAKDGGLYVPVSMDKPFDYKELLGKKTTEMAEKVFAYYFDEFTDIAGIVSRAYTGKFDTEELTPLKKVGDRCVLELFHGPTSAFKDVALSALPQFMTEAKKLENMEEEILILTATSGDTGKAALEGFRDVPGIRITVFFPYGGVSPVQEKQMTTQEGENVCSVAVRGNFDDTQTGVKRIFTRVSSEGLPEGAKKTVLSSANSINIGRLVPQIVYYMKAYSDLVTEGVIKDGEKVDFTVPTGNFGDILAGYLAKRMGLPVGRLICASNANNVLTDFIETGKYDKNRPFIKTFSPSMDILVSSNLERLLYFLSGEDTSSVEAMMAALSESGVYEITDGMLEKLREDFSAGYADDEETLCTIREVFEKEHYLLDTHTAVAWRVADRYMKETQTGRPNVILSTASPYKFPKAVLTALKEEGPEDEFDIMDRLFTLTGVPVPKNLSTLREKEVRFREVVDREAMYDFVMGEINA